MAIDPAEHYDVAVVGAGPAGSAAALAARRAGARVLLLDRAEFPRDKPCGDGIAADAVDVLAGLGVTGLTDGYPPVADLRLVGPGGGQVWVEGTTLFIGHMRWPSGTTIVDVADPRHPRALATIDLPEGWHSHKVRVANDVMIVNHEKQGPDGDASFGGGLGIYFRGNF